MLSECGTDGLPSFRPNLIAYTDEAGNTGNNLFDKAIS